VTALAACAPGEERAIRNQLSDIAETLSVPANDGDLGRLSRIASLRKALAPDVQVTTGVSARSGAPLPSEISGRDGVLAFVGRWSPPPAGVTVEFVDVQVTLDDSRMNAQVYCTVQVMSGTAEKPVVDARELTIGFSRIDGEWLMTSIRPEETLSR
jgi:hypothetical protein